MYKYNPETLGFLSAWQIIVVATTLALIIIAVIVLCSVTAFCAKTLGFGHQLNEDDPKWLEYCRQLDNKQH